MHTKPAVRSCRATFQHLWGTPVVVMFIAGVGFVVWYALTTQLAEAAAEDSGWIDLPFQQHAKPDPGLIKQVKSLTESLKDDDHNVRREAARDLQRLGPDAASAVPDLVIALDDEDGDVSGWAGRALAAIGSPSVTALTESLTHESIKVRLDAAYTLATLRDKAKPALPTLIGLLTDKTYTGNWRLDQAIVCIGQDVIPALEAQLDEPDFEVRLRVAGVLSRFRKDGAQAIPTLREALKRDDAVTRRSGMFYLVEMGPVAAIALPDMLATMDDPDDEVRRGALHAISLHQHTHEEVTPAIIAALNDPANRNAAASILSRSKPKQAVPALIHCLNDEDLVFRAAAAFALAHIKPDTKPLLPALIGLFEMTEQTIVVHALAQLGPLAAPALPQLSEALDNKSADIRRAAVSAIGAIGPDTPGVIDALVKALDDKDYIVRLGAVGELMRMGKKAKPALPALNGLRDRSDEVSDYAATAARVIQGLPPEPDKPER